MMTAVPLASALPLISSITCVTLDSPGQQEVRLGGTGAGPEQQRDPADAESHT